jgi:antitoxin VapB
MAMSIKSEQTHRLVKELAELTGESQSKAVEEAVRERLERVRQRSGESLSERLLAIGRDIRSRLDEPWLSVDHGELLYDEQGLPK